MRQTLWFNIEIDVDAEAASKLPGFPGENWGDTVEEPIAGIQIESDIICEELMRLIIERLPKRLQAQAINNHVQVSAPFDPASFVMK